MAELNEAGGVLGETVEAVTADDYCDGEQAVAAAAKLIADGVVAVMGHSCSGAAIPASAAYARAGIVMISWEWYVWQADGTYVPFEQSVAKQ